jgi:hypothetical protein
LIYHDVDRPTALPHRAAGLVCCAAVLAVGTLLGHFWLPTLSPRSLLAGQGILVVVALWRVRTLPWLRPWRWWRWLWTGAVVAGWVLERVRSGAGEELIEVGLALLLGESVAVAAVSVPWPRELAAWRPLLCTGGRTLGVAAGTSAALGGLWPAAPLEELLGALLAAVVGLFLLSLTWPARPIGRIDGEWVRLRRAPCPRCGVPVDWAAERASSCPTCGLIRRVPGSGL